MKIVKITLAVIASFAVSAISFAGELTVTGSAKATYAIQSSESTTTSEKGMSNGKGIGIANEFTLSASGETDQGISWAYAQDIDGSTVQDDAKLTLSMPTFGTVGIMVSEGGLSSKYKWNVSAYAPGSDYGLTGTSASSHATGDKLLVGYTNGSDIGGYNNFQYHTPSGLLPYGTSVKLAYAPNSQAASANSSSNNAGDAVKKTGANGSNAQQVLIESKPMDGLDVALSYFTLHDSPVGLRNDYEAAHLAAKYAYGQFSFGAQYGHVVPTNTKADITTYVKYYDNTSVGVAFNVNDALSVSFTQEQSESNRQIMSETGTGQVKTSVETDIKAIQAAYTMGGMTMSIARKEIENMNYEKAVDASETVFAVSLAF